MSGVECVQVVAQSRIYDIEYRFCGAMDDPDAPWVVFLHEGLGCSALWRDFPDRLCEAAGLRGLVYSRPGYGFSTPRPENEQWGPDFMHVQARELLPALLIALGIEAPIWLVGHSDGGSIALIYGALFPPSSRGLILIAPHILVEDISITNIRAARDQYQYGDLRARLGRYHADPDSAFYGWCDVWLSDAFRRWDLYHEAARLRCPILAVQGLDDEYGTLMQIRGIAARAPQTELVEIADCGHWPHRDAADVLLTVATRFLTSSVDP